MVLLGAIGSSQEAFIILLVKIACIIICVNKAKKLNRSPFWWGALALFISVLAVIVIHLVRPLSEEEKIERRL